MITYELKPCPMCGSGATLKDQRLVWSVECDNPQCRLHILGDRAIEPETEAHADAIDWEWFAMTAVARWNLRTDGGTPT